MVFIMLLLYDKEWTARKQNRRGTILNEPVVGLGGREFWTAHEPGERRIWLGWVRHAAYTHWRPSSA
jgi:hypothetical protein